jgi:hypothetical protein
MLQTIRAALVVVPLMLAAAAAAGERAGPSSVAAQSPAATDSLCLLIESAASANGLPPEYFVRLIWQESRFKADAIGPATRNGQRASGIAQFMPGTAAERGLLDPLDPIAALPKSAEFLRDLRGEFGNLGLAAAAYNAGSRRVHDWLAGTGGLPAQTRDYVVAITGRTAEDWRNAKDGNWAAPSSCPDLVAGLKRAPGGFVAELEQRISTGMARAWGVELAAGFSRERVLKTYATLETRYRALLAGTDAIILHGRFRSRGTRDFYQVRIGAQTRSEAGGVCARLHAAGAACLVLRNSHGSAEAIGASPHEREATSQDKEEGK